MSTKKLESTMEQACKDLAWIYEAVAKVRSSGTLSEESFKFFDMSSDLAVQIEHAKGLLYVREVALTAAKIFPTQTLS